MQKLQNDLIRIFRSLAKIGADPNDSEELRVQKAISVYGIILAGFPSWGIWTTLLFLFDESDAAWVEVGWFSLCTILLILFGIYPRIFPFSRVVILLSFLIVPFIVSVQLGGIANSGAVFAWSLITPLFALALSGPRYSIRWFLACAVIIVISGVIDPHVRAPNNLPPRLITVLFMYNILVMAAVIFTALHYFMRQRDEAYRLLGVEQAKSEGLLLNILPANIAARLKQGEETIADHHDAVTILFMDIVNFTPLSASATPEKMVRVLSEIFSQFDQWVEEYDAQKIETVGDSYMVATGLSRPRPDHAQVVTQLALEIRSYFERGVFLDEQRLDCRIGINSGPVTAGVIERKRIAYHVWGDTVNTASRMESQGVPGQIQISQATYELIKDDYVCESRGTILIKGKGDMDLWLVRGSRAKTT